ncbi:MAG TPA: class I SAM-dependent methyltransferase [Phycisphaerales bacterium]|nr:class I SAM-dependent methyltransferase [Phycisphaerales bacterium]HMP37794.1 class I SAM-dependent methyltransferase [Phycisphaerales bacterium]
MTTISHDDRIAPTAPRRLDGPPADASATRASAPTAPGGGADALPFSDRFLRMLNDAAAILMISVGHRTGLFDAMTRLAWASSEEIASEAALHERYVREWLSAMTVARIVEHDAVLRRFRLPPEHAALLTRAASPSNLASTAQFIGELARVEIPVVECFRKGGGVPYAGFRCFHDVMADESDQTVVAHLDERVLPLVPGLESRLAEGIDVLDIGCGRGRAIVALAVRFPSSRFVGYDLCADAIEDARRLAAPRGLSNVRFETRDVTHLDEPGSYDLVTAFDAIHDQARPDIVLAAVRRALRPDGVFLMQDIRASSELARNLDHPLGTYLYTISCMHCMTVSLAQGGLGLGTAWGEELAVAMLREAGFADVSLHRIEEDITNNWYVAR